MPSLNDVRVKERLMGANAAVQKAEGIRLRRSARGARWLRNNRPEIAAAAKKRLEWQRSAHAASRDKTALALPKKPPYPREYSHIARYQLPGGFAASRWAAAAIAVTIVEFHIIIGVLVRIRVGAVFPWGVF